MATIEIIKNSALATAIIGIPDAVKVGQENGIAAGIVTLAATTLLSGITAATLITLTGPFGIAVVCAPLPISIGNLVSGAEIIRVSELNNEIYLLGNENYLI